MDNSPRLLDGEVPVGVPSRLSGIAQVRLSVVTEVSERTVWNTAREHPHGMTTFAGCQVRYLVTSEHGILGAVGISAAALTGPRPLDGAVPATGSSGGLSESVSASGAVPGAMFRGGFSGVCRGTSRPGMDSVPWWWKPVRTRAGTCLRAANFVCAGRTKGRQDRHHRAAKTVNGCAVWIGDASWGWVRSLLPGPGDGLDGAVWAVNEFGGAGDKRLSARLVKSAALLASCPGFTRARMPTTRRSVLSAA